MKATNDQIIIETQHMVSKKMFAWKLAQHAIPAEAHLQTRNAELRKKYKQLVADENPPLNKDGTVNFEKADEDIANQLTDISLKILKTDMDRLSCILELEDELPEGIAEIIKEKHLFSQKELPEDKTPEKKKSETSQSEIDAILDKISERGYDALTKEEKQKLFNASKD